MSALPSVEDCAEFVGTCDMGWCDRLTVAVVWTSEGWRSSCKICALPALTALTAPRSPSKQSASPSATPPVETGSQPAGKGEDMP